MLDFLFAFFRRRSVAFIVLFLGITISIWAFWYANKNFDERERLRFEAVCSQVTTLIKSRMDGYRQILYTGVGFFESSQNVTREEWRTFVASMQIQENYEGIQGIGFAQVVAPNELLEHTNAVRAEGFSDYKIYPEQEREFYTSILYLEPFDERNQRAFGYDMFSQETRKEAMTRAYISQKAAASGKVRLIQEDGVDEQGGFLIYVPLYHKNMPRESEAEKKAALKGFVFAPFRAKDLMRGVVGERFRDVHLEIYDTQEISPNTLLYRERAPASISDIKIIKKIQVDGREWTLVYRPFTNFFYEVQRSTPLFILLFGLLLTVMLFALIISLVYIKDKAQDLAKQMTEKLFSSEERLRFALEGSGDGIWDWNLTNDEVFFSKRWKEMFGFSEDEIGNSLDEWKKRVHPKEISQVLEGIQKHLESSTPFYSKEYRALCKDGTYKWVLDRGIVVVRDEDGKPLRMVGSHTDISAEKEALAKLKESKEQFELAVRGTKDGIWDWNVTTGHLFFSRRWKEIFGRADEDIAFHIDSFSGFIYEEDKEKASRHIQDYFEGKIEKYELELRVNHKTEGVIWTLSKAEALRDENGKVYRLAGSLSNINANKQAQEELRLAKESAEEANMSKSSFLANMSHEIRTPMNAVLGLSQLLLDEKLQAKQRDMVEKIFSSSKMLLGIINDILDYSKIEAQKLELEQKGFSLDSILAQQRVLFANNKLNQGVELYFYAKSDLPFSIVADELRLDQVLSNLLSNALKFTHEGKVILSIELLKRFEKSAILSFSVIDSGIGLRQDEIEKLFQPFVQADSSTTRKYGGSGLGLVISRKLVHAMGGELHVESIKGKGSVFSFSIEVPVLSWEREKRRKEESYRVLIVDDQEISRLILKEMLLDFRCRIDEASNGAQALEMIIEADSQNQGYSSLLVDWKMPVMDGVEMIQELNKMVQEKRLQTKPPSILMISGYNAEELDVDRLDIEGFLAKPITSSSLFDALAMLDNSIVHNMQEHKAEQVPNMQGVRVLLVEDNAINQEVAAMMLERVGIKVVIANNGKEGVELFMAHPKEFDLILMDLQMPIMSGYEATQIIRQSNKLIPIIALTAAAMVEDREKVLEAGMNDHLGKPIERENMYEKIAYWTELNMSKPVFDELYALDVVNQNRELLLKLLTKFVAQLEEEFGTIAKKLAASDEDTAASIHALKGVSGNLGAKKLYEITTKINALLRKNEPIAQEMQEKFAQNIQELKEKLREFIASKETIEIQSEQTPDMLDSFIQEVAQDLEKNNIVCISKQTQLLQMLQGKIIPQELQEWQSAMEEFEYKKAFEIMRGWKI